MTKLSIIIPIYNNATYLKQCLNSITAQNFNDFEILCINDASTDNSTVILNRLAAEDSRIRIFNLPSTQGAGAARNLGISHAKGEYIHFLDSDDWLEPDIYTPLLAEIEQTAADICFFQYNRIYGKITTQVNLFTSQQTEQIKSFHDNPKFFINSSVVPWNKIYKTSFIKKNGLQFDTVKCANDRYFYFSLFPCNPKICFHTGHFVNYRCNQKKSLSRQNDLAAYQCHLATFAKILNLYSNHSEYIRSLLIDTGIKDLQNMQHDQHMLPLEIRKQILSFLNKQNIHPSYYVNCPWAAWYKRLSFAENIIPIVFACNEKYLPYLSVTLTSLQDNAAPGYNYDIYILCNELSSAAQQKITYFNASFPQAAIEAVNVSKIIDHQHLYSCAHYSREMYYRLLIPELLQSYPKVLYLDCDLIVNANISELYQTDIDQYLFAAVINYTNPGMRQYIQKSLNLSPKTYFNSGVLLINTQNCLKYRLKERCLKFISTMPNLCCPDQDALNKIARGKVKFLDLKWNFYWQFLVLHHPLENIGSLPPDEQQHYLQTLRQSPAIIHYTSGKKPWNNVSSVLSILWWNYARRSILHHEIKLQTPAPNGLNAKLLYDATHRFSLLWQFWRSKILSCLTFGRKHTHYKRKRKAFKQRLKAIKQLAG